jgi:hypothetical protein
MISFLNKKSFLNTNQFKVFIVVNLPYTTHGSNHLIFGGKKCFKIFLNLKSSLFSRFKVHAFNNKKVEISLTYGHGKIGFLNSSLSKNKSLYFQKNNIITFLNNNIFENFNSNNVIMINHNFFGNSKKYFKAMYYSPIVKKKKKIYNFDQKKMYKFLNSKAYEPVDKSVNYNNFSEDLLITALSFLYEKAFFDQTFLQEIQEGDFVNYKKFIFFIDSVLFKNTKLMLYDKSKLFTYGYTLSEYELICNPNYDDLFFLNPKYVYPIVYKTIFNVFLSNEFLEFLPTAITLEFGNEKPFDVFKEIELFFIENYHSNKILNLKILETNRKIIKKNSSDKHFFERFKFKYYEGSTTNRLDKKRLKLFLKINLNQKLVSTSITFVKMQEIFIDIVLIQIQKTFFKIRLTNFVWECDSVNDSSLYKYQNGRFGDWFEFKPPHSELIAKVYLRFISHSKVSKYLDLESDEFLFFLRYALSFIESRHFIIQVIRCLDFEYNSMHKAEINRSVNQREEKNFNPLNEVFVDCFKYKYSKKFISIKNVKLN